MDKVKKCNEILLTGAPCTRIAEPGRNFCAIHPRKKGHRVTVAMKKKKAKKR
jgi:hypothetical protein